MALTNFFGMNSETNKCPCFKRKSSDKSSMGVQAKTIWWGEGGKTVLLEKYLLQGDLGAWSQGKILKILQLFCNLSHAITTKLKVTDFT